MENKFVKSILGQIPNETNSEINAKIKRKFIKEIQAVMDKYHARIDLPKSGDSPAFYLKDLLPVQGVWFPNHVWMKNFEKPKTDN